MATYRYKIDYTYSRNNEANSAETAINNWFTSNGYPYAVSKSGSTVTITITGLTATQADHIRDGLIPAWSVGTRAGKSSCVIEGGP